MSKSLRTPWPLQPTCRFASENKKRMVSIFKLDKRMVNLMTSFELYYNHI